MLQAAEVMSYDSLTSLQNFSVQMQVKICIIC